LTRKAARQQGLITALCAAVVTINLRSNMSPVTKLRIADVVIQVESRESLWRLAGVSPRNRFRAFLGSGRARPQIAIDVRIVDKLPQVRASRHVFSVYQSKSGRESWRIMRGNKSYIYFYTSLLGRLEQLIVAADTLDTVTAYLLPRKDKGFIMGDADIIRGFLKILLINYWALNNTGIIAHSVGIRDSGASGLLFAGASGSGKSTTARIWHEHSLARVLNDDHVVITRANGVYSMHGSPWYGNFNGYPVLPADSAVLNKIFFICHARGHYGSLALFFFVPRQFALDGLDRLVAGDYHCQLAVFFRLLGHRLLIVARLAVFKVIHHLQPDEQYLLLTLLRH